MRTEYLDRWQLVARDCDQFSAVCKIARSPSLIVTPDLTFAFAVTLTATVSQQAESEAVIVAIAYFRAAAQTGFKLKSEDGSGVCICEPFMIQNKPLLSSENQLCLTQIPATRNI